MDVQTFCRKKVQELPIQLDRYLRFFILKKKDKVRGRAELY